MPKTKTRPGRKLPKKLTRADEVRIQEAFNKKLEEFDQFSLEELQGKEKENDLTKTIRGTYLSALKEAISNKMKLKVKEV